MTEQMKVKLSNFIDSIIENKINSIVIDIWSEPKKHTYYALDIDTGIPSNRPNLITNYNLHFAVCPQTGLVLLTKDEFEEFRVNDVDFAIKYSEILQQTKNKILCKNLDLIVDTSSKELKLNRDQNIKKLIG